MLYQLPDGRTVEISVYDYLELSDEELKGLMGYQNIGVVITNPMYGSAIRKPDKSTEQEFPDTLDDADYIIEEE